MGEVLLEVTYQRADGAERSPPERLAGEDAEPRFDQIPPRGARRRKMELNARVRGEPALHGGRRVRRRIVEDDVQVLAWIGPGEPFQKPQEVRAGMARRAYARDAAGAHVERCVETDEAMSLIVVRLPRGQVGRSGNMGCVRSKAWICVFSSTLSTTAFVGGAR